MASEFDINLAVKAIQGSLNKCGDPVVLIPTGNWIAASSFTGYIVEVEPCVVKDKNQCCDSVAIGRRNAKGQINRVYLGLNIVSDIHSSPFTHEDIVKVYICNTEGIVTFDFVSIS